MEGRRGARVATTFLVAIEDIDQSPKLRQGDISLSGVYFETAEELGAPGTVHWLQLVSVDHTRRVRVMACVVRVATRGRLRGAAFEFMPESDDAVTALQNFVKYALGLRAAGSTPYIAPRLEAKAAPHEASNLAQRAMVGKLSVRSMVLETSWAVEPGASLRVEIAAPGMPKRIRLEGTAVRVAHGASTPGYTIEVEVHEESDRPLAHSSMSFAKVTVPESSIPPPPPPTSQDDVTEESLRSLDELLASLINPPADARKRKRAYHLAGQLPTIPLTTLASLFEMERMTGELAVRKGKEKVRVYVDGGRIIDVAPLGPGDTPRSRIQAVLGWREGSFEFDMKAVSRQDRVGTSTTALLLDLARETDEEAERDRTE
jgi:hypothetical protein